MNDDKNYISTELKLSLHPHQDISYVVASVGLAPALRKNSIDLALCDNFIGFDLSGFHHEKNQWCRRPFIRFMIG